MTMTDFIQALQGAFQHRVRAALTLLGIVIGTGSIVLLASLIRGGESYLVHASQEAEDSDVIEAYSQDPPPNQQNKTTRNLSRTDGSAISGAMPEGAMVTTESSFDTYALFQTRRKRVAIVSSTDVTMKMYRLSVAHGRALDATDRTEARRVCVIGYEVHDDLLRNAPVGGADKPLHILVDGHIFSVVGVLAKKPMIGNTDSTYMWDRKVLIPDATYDALYTPEHGVNSIYVRSTPIGAGKGTKDAQQATRATVKGVLLRRHLGVTNFTLSKDQSGGTEQLILTVIQVLLIGAGGLALLASGINIMNVMLVTVSERKKEIGLRRAIGATPRSIMLQFLLEAATLSLVGALLGVVFGVAISWGTAKLAESGIGYWEFTVPSWSLALGITLAVATGLLFGILPAWRAAKVSPIDALRAD
jgi:putative ABC transport system permease protein